MTIKIGINGFGRIGRLVTRAISEYDIDDMEIVAINSPGAQETSAHLLRYDSVHGRFAAEVKSGEGFIDFGRGKVRMTHERDPANARWDDLDVDVVMECSGVFRTRERAMPHIDAGAKSVLISAPAEGVDKTVVYGVNHQNLTKDDIMVSCASCTTNCLAPVAHVIMGAVGIRRGFMTTVHAVRVPTANVSMVDLAFQPEKKTSAEELNAFVKNAAENDMKGVLRYTEEPLVSSDLNHDPHSAIYAAPLTKVLDGDLVKVIAWYDNEWGFACRMIDVARVMGQNLKG